MNKLPAMVKEILSKDALTIVTFDFQGISLSMMSLEVDNIKTGSSVVLGVKPTNVALAKDFQGSVSYSNQIEGVIQEIKEGELLVSLKVEIDKGSYLTSIITCRSSKRMGLRTGEEVTLFMKASDISILEVIDD